MFRDRHAFLLGTKRVLWGWESPVLSLSQLPDDTPSFAATLNITYGTEKRCVAFAVAVGVGDAVVAVAAKAVVTVFRAYVTWCSAIV